MKTTHLPTMMLAVAMVTPLPKDMTTQWEMKSCSGLLEKAKKRQPSAQMRPPMTPYSRGLFLRQMIVMNGAMKSEMPTPRLPNQAARETFLKSILVLDSY